MKLIIITGQTATGKTNLALEYAKKYDGELINCDSRQMYKHLNIITGKDIQPYSDFHNVKKIDNFDIGYFQLSTIPIWLYDIVDPKDHFSAFDYRIIALATINEILERGKTPIIIGGTYFYLKHLLYGNIPQQTEPNWELRKELETKTVQQLQEQLQKLNTDIFNKMNDSDKQNPRRLIRRIEILTDKKEFIQTPSNNENIDIQKYLHTKNIEIEYIGLAYKDKEKLVENISKRVEKRLLQGAVIEVENLLTQEYRSYDPGLQTIGYQQIIAYLEATISFEEMKKQWITKEIQYAKRQTTFMKQDKNIEWKEI